MWHWADEPDLDADDGYLPPSVLRSWTYKCHELDPQHLVKTGLAGPPWVHTDEEDWWSGRRRKYAYPYNADQFGAKVHVTDVYGLDYYPFDWLSPHHHDASFEKMARALDAMKADTYNLVPFFSAIETTDINESPYPTPWYPTPEHLKMIMWLNVVHGAKGIVWFHYFKGTPADNFTAMADFVDDITTLTPVILGPATDRTVSIDVDYSKGIWTSGTAYSLDNEVQFGNACYSCTAAHTGSEATKPGTGIDWHDYWVVEDRVDTMIRDYNGKVYLFLVFSSVLRAFINPSSLRAISAWAAASSDSGRYPIRIISSVSPFCICASLRDSI